MHIAPQSFDALRIVASVYNQRTAQNSWRSTVSEDEHGLSDLDFRRTLIVPSYDCIMMRRRSKYIGRTIRTQPTTLLAMSTPLECLLRVQEDLRCAWNNRGIARERTTPPDLEAPFCGDVMRDKGRWAQVVKSVHFFESALDDRFSAKRTVAATLSKTHDCIACHNKFASERASAAHAQRAHGYRTERSKRVDDSSVCPVCKATFQTRIRVLACRTEVVDLPELPEEPIFEVQKKLMLLRSAPPAGTDAVHQQRERARRVMTARRVLEGSKAVTEEQEKNLRGPEKSARAANCDNTYAAECIAGHAFLKGSQSLVFQHIDAGSVGEMPGCKLAAC